MKNSIISFYEVGDRFPSPEIIVKLARVLCVSSDYLLGLEPAETVDVLGLCENDILLVRMVIDFCRKKNDNSSHPQCHSPRNE